MRINVEHVTKPFLKHLSKYCLVGYFDNIALSQYRSGVVNNLQQDANSSRLPLNGSTHRRPRWLQGRNMFLIPRPISNNDQITISGVMTQQQKGLTVILGTENESEVAFQFDANFDTNVVRINQNELTWQTTDIFTDNQFVFKFDFLFYPNEGGNVINFYVGGNPLEVVPIQHSMDEITYISLTGDISRINELSFKFAK